MKKIVTIGGGTGSFTLFRASSSIQSELSAIVSMADDGGSTGILRDELGVLPPGDVRQCLVALSDSSETLRDLMTYRFEHGGLSGHSFGNLLLSALEKITGDFLSAVHEAATLLNVRGEVLPVTSSDTELCVTLKNGTKLRGEHAINTDKRLGRTGIRRTFLEPKPVANPNALQKIREADLIVIGPGNHYCSILPQSLGARHSGSYPTLASYSSLQL
ncbi:MAG: gluconeogenesis factor YvcK family protein [Candidatus Moraniibacteriota bacterium]